MRSLRKQLTRSILLGALLAAACAGAATYAVLRASLLRQFDAALLSKAQALAVLVEQEKNGRVDVEPDDVRALGFGTDGTDHFFQLWRDDGAAIARSPSSRGAGLPRAPSSPAVPFYFDVELPRDRDGRAVVFQFAPRLADEGEHDAKASLPVTLEVASERESLDATLNALAAALGLSGGFLLLGIGILVPRVLGRELRPLDDLATGMAAITADSLSVRFPEENLPLELKPIAARLNDLLARLQASFERERHFSANLAHELRTPLAELRSQAELSLKWPDERPPQADAETLAIARRMERLVSNLLALARSENGRPSASSEPLAVPEIVGQAWHTFAAAASGKGVAIEFENRIEGQVLGDPTLLLEILTNLFGNAVQHTATGGKISAVAQEVGGAFCLTVSNPVQALTQADVDKFFDRFWRKEASRTGDEHAGLGLSLSRSYARAMGWELKAQLSEASLITLSLTAPQALDRLSD